ncbi:hypothetical protein QEN19_000776 [Hanseniaspora menglaensis]
MARKPGFNRSSRSSNHKEQNTNINFLKFSDYYDYGATRETDGDRFAVSDIKKAMNCYYDALICYEKGIQIYQKNCVMLAGDLENYQKIWYNYLRLVFYLLSEYKFVSGSVEIINYLPENTIKKEMRDLIFDKANILEELLEGYNYCKNIISLSEDTWDFYFNFLEFLKSVIEWYNTDKLDMSFLMNILVDQQLIYDELLCLQSNVLMKYINNIHSNNNNSTDPVIQANMNIQKNLRFKVSNESDNFAETMSNLTLSTFMEIQITAFTSVRIVTEYFYQNINKQTLQTNFTLLDSLKTMNQGYENQYRDFLESIHSYDLKQHLDEKLSTELEYASQFNSILFRLSDKTTIDNLINSRLIELNDLPNLQVQLEKSKVLLEIDQWDTILEILLPFETVIKYAQKGETTGIKLNPFNELYSWETQWNLAMVLNKLTQFVNKEMGNKIKTTLQKNKSFSAECCNLVEILQSKSDLEIKRAYLKSVPDGSGKINMNDVAILSNNSVAYLKNAITYINFDMGLGELINDKLYRNYLLTETIEKLKQAEQLIQ